MKAHQERLNSQYKNESLELLSYEGFKKPCIIKCLVCGTEYQYQRYADAVRNSKKYLCKKCGKQQYIQNKFEQSLFDIFKNEPFELIEFVDTQHSMKIKCKKCNKIREYQVADSIKSASHICPCYNNNKESLQIWNRFYKFINNSTNWTLLDKKYIPNSPSQELISCICTKCGKINQKSIYDYMRGIQCTCSRWGDIKQQLMQEIGNEYKILSQPTHTRNRVMIQHNCGYIYSINPKNFINGYSRCPQCYKRRSRGEKRILNWLKQNNIEYIREYIQEIEGHLLRYDFYLPDYQLYIEYQGEQHYKAVDFFGGKKKFEEVQYYDRLKRQYAQENLLEISYKDYNSIDNILESVVQRLAEKRTSKQKETKEIEIYQDIV